LRSKKVIHRDLKLGNLLLGDSMMVKVCDFGLAVQLDSFDEMRQTVCGTPNYIAPEMLDKNSAGHSFEVDIWALGIIIYALIIGKPPFETKDVNSTYKRIKDCYYDFPASVNISPAAKNLI
jgi:serine/threonine protein kinase